MATRVANIKYQDYDVYVGRAGKGHDGYFGNPIKPYKLCQVCGARDHHPGETIDCFATYFAERIAVDAEYRRRVFELKDKVLGCFCHPKKCHAKVIAAWLDAR